MEIGAQPIPGSFCESVLCAQDILARVAVAQGVLQDLGCVSETSGRCKSIWEEEMGEELEYEIFECRQELLQDARQGPFGKGVSRIQSTGDQEPESRGPRAREAGSQGQSIAPILLKSEENQFTKSTRQI